MKKSALDPLMLGLGAAATAATVAFSAKEVQARRELMEALKKSYHMKRRLMKAVTAAAGLGGAAGYIAAKKQPKQKEKTTVVQPIVVNAPAAQAPLTAESAREILKGASARRKQDGNRRKLHKMVRPFGGVYKTRTAKGWDVMTDAVLSDTGTGSGK